MNANLVRRVVMCSLGAVIGGGIAALIMKRVYPEYEEVIEEENGGWIKEPEYGVYFRASGEQEKVILEPTKRKKKGEGKDMIDYTALAKKYSDVNKEAKERLGEKAKDASDEEETVFSVISLDDYNNLSNPNEKMVLTYYAEDKVLCDNTDSVIKEPEMLIGDGLTRFGEKSGDPDIVYIRNGLMMVDYLIVRANAKYTEEVQNEKPQKPKAKPSRRTRKSEELEDDEE